ncbi:DUF4034 domain-containing protein [Pseudomonas sp. S60]|uniref:DUF4034 domain-containing protein n=1 Tax=Pseudomonas sp. S60 TaxID=211124 RepID=UPI0019147569|nr:DUF4034 domain-containing protein [Pseudomonas sp. S60]MBK5010739.1 DUF4034 domain-containing protein [Pseudomonas sp. S60]
MQTLTHTREAIRELVQASAFVELNRFFDSLEARWRQALPGEFPAYMAAVEGHMLVAPEQGDRALSQVLKAWIDACPRAYHPQVVMGFHCFNRARQVDQSGTRTAARFLAVEQMCETATAHLLRAMAHSRQPATAAIGMLHISAHFREPGWLIELFQHQPARFRPSANADVEVQEAAAPFLVRHGVLPLAELPKVLPAGLQPRNDEPQEAPHHYWMRHALAAWPGCFEAVQAYAQYLLPRWGGSLQAVELLASGPLCENWSEALRNALRWMAIEDRLVLPAFDQPQTVDDYQALCDAWAKRPLRPRDNAVVLAWRGALRSCAIPARGDAFADFVASLACDADLGAIQALGQPFKRLVRVALASGAANEQALLHTAMLRLCEGRSHAAACALRAAAYRFGLWGMARNGEQARHWLQVAVRRQRAGQAPGFELLDLVRLLWSANRHEVACYLLERCAELNLRGAALAMFELHHGDLGHTPEHYLDDEVAERWLQRAVEAGSRQAKYRLACLRMRGDANLRDRTTMLGVRRLLIDALGHPQTNACARLRLGMLLRQFGHARERAEAVAYLLSLVEHPDPWIAARASAELGLAWMQGRGTRRQSRYAAIEWVNHAATLQPGDSVIEHIHAEVLNSNNRVKTLFTQCGAALFRGNLRPGELPPKAAPHAFARRLERPFQPL